MHLVICVSGTWPAVLLFTEFDGTNWTKKSLKLRVSIIILEKILMLHKTSWKVCNFTWLCIYLHFRYSSLLADCQHCYLSQRSQLLTPCVSDAIDKLAKQYERNPCSLVSFLKFRKLPTISPPPPKSKPLNLLLDDNFSDQHLISRYNINTFPSRQVMRI